MMSLSNHDRWSIHRATRIVSPMVSGPAACCQWRTRGLKWGGELTEAGINDAEARLNFGDGVCSSASSKTHAYHLIMTNIAMENPNHKWRFLAGKSIYFYDFLWAIYTMAMLNNQRVSPKCSRFQFIQPPENTHEVCWSFPDVFFLFSSGNSAGSGWLRAVGRRSLEGTSEVKRRLAQMFLWFWVHRNDRKDTVKLQYPTINEWWIYHLFFLGVTIYIIYS